MPRQYFGDINGSFKFIDQPSTDAEQFGAIPGENTVIAYCVSEIEPVETRLAELFDEVGWDIDLDMSEDEFDKKHSEHLGVNPSAIASIGLGLKIYQCIKEKGDCCFEAET